MKPARDNRPIPGAMKPALRILIVEDLANDSVLELRELDKAGIGYVARRVETEIDMRRELSEFHPDIILSDFNLPKFDSLTALAMAKALRPDTPFVFVSGAIGAGQAIEALRMGATDYVLKSNPAQLVPAVQRAIRETEEHAAQRQAEAAVRQSQKKYESLVNAIDGIVWEMEVPSCRFSFVSKQAERILGYPLRAWLEEPNFWKDHMHPDDRDRVLAYCQQQTAERNSHSFDYRMLAVDGHTLWLRDYVSVIAEPGQPVKLQGVLVDITEPRNQKQKIARLNRVYAVLSGINANIVRAQNRQELFDETCRIAVEDGRFKHASIRLVDEASGEIRHAATMGEGTEPLAGQNAVAEALRCRQPVVIDDLGPVTDTTLNNAAPKQGLRSLAVLPLIVGKTPVGTLTLYAGEAGFFDQDEMKLLGQLAADISFALEYLKKQEQLNYLAYYDSLTGLPNRSLLHDRLAQALLTAGAGNKKLPLILVDLVNFKLVNDSLGKDAGDAALRGFAARLRVSLPADVTLARVAGDVFALAHTGTGDGVDIAQPLVEKVLGACEPALDVAGHEIRMYVKLGIAIFPGDGANAEILFRNAETALKKAKRSVEPGLYYSPEMNARISESLAIRNKLRRAIDDQQFVLHFQPILDLSSGYVCGAEALVRWNDPETGMVPPTQFIPLMEETGMILDLGRWVLDEAQSIYAGWQDEGINPPRISVNVSAIQLRHKSFVNDVLKAIEKNPSSGIDIEITESVMMEDVEKNTSKLRAVRDMGMGISIDDFGTGYSSLSYLAKLPIHALKIDRAFIMNIADNPNDMTLVSTIISLAHALNLKVVAEGVETSIQSNLLKLLRCDMMQGYLFSRPLPADEFKTLLSWPAQTMPN